MIAALQTCCRQLWILNDSLCSFLRCCCGRPENWQGHVPQALGLPSEERWHPYRHTESKPTDAYGVLEFQGAPHPSKAQVSIYFISFSLNLQFALLTNFGLFCFVLCTS